MHKGVEGILIEELVSPEEFLGDGLVGPDEHRRIPSHPRFPLIYGIVEVEWESISTADFSKHALVVIAIPAPHKFEVGGILAVKDQPLLLLPIDNLFDLIGYVVVVEFSGDKGKSSVYCVVLGGNIINGRVSDEYGKNEADDGGYDLTAIGEGLPLLQVQVLQ